MKQIFTITRSLRKAKAFDDEVNAALAEGWKLIEREVLASPARLYAALERTDWVPSWASCDNCLETNRESIHARCHSCKFLSQWAPSMGPSKAAQSAVQTANTSPCPSSLNPAPGAWKVRKNTPAGSRRKGQNNATN